jgi:hypothetical protein
MDFYGNTGTSECAEIWQNPKRYYIVVYGWLPCDILLFVDVNANSAAEAIASAQAIACGGNAAKAA